MWLVVTAMALRLRGYRRWHEFLARHAAPQQAPPDGAAGRQGIAAQASRLVAAAARRLPLPRNCLRESMVLWWLLLRKGIRSELRFGGRRVQERFEAHAWVEFEGCVLNDTDDVARRFLPFQPADLPAGAKFL